MNFFSGEAIKAFLIGLLGLLLALALGVFIGSGDYQPIVIGALAVCGLVLWFGTGQWFWIIAIASSYLGGTFPILGGSFTPFQILMVVGVAKFFIEEVILRRTPFAKVERPLLLAILGFMTVLTLHGIHDRFGMRFLGSNVWGGRNYLNVYVGLVTFFVIQSTSVRSKVWNKLPYLVLAITGFDLFIAAITTVFPSLIYIIYPFYSAVGTGGISELLTGQEDIGGRIGSFGNFGCILVAIVLSAVSVRRLFQLGNLSRLATVGLGSLATLYSGYRSAVANLLFTFLTAGIRDLRWRVIAILPIIAVFLFGLSAINSSIVRFPKQMQRGLVFLPGDWDLDMVHDAAASNDFRVQIWKLWWEAYFPVHPVIGRGFGFRSEWTAPSLKIAASQDYQQMVEVGNIHNGLFASLDAVGIIGTIFFVAWNIQLLLRTFRISFDKSIPAGFAMRFVAIQLAASILCYWFGAVTLGTFLPQQFALAGVFLKLHRDANPTAERVRPTLQPIHQERRRAVVGA